MNEFALGAGFSAADLVLLIASLVAVTALIWMAWVTWGQFEAWTEQPERVVPRVFLVTRGIVLLLLLLVFIR